MASSKKSTKSTGVAAESEQLESLTANLLTLYKKTKRIADETPLVFVREPLKKALAEIDAAVGSMKIAMIGYGKRQVDQK